MIPGSKASQDNDAITLSGAAPTPAPDAAKTFSSTAPPEPVPERSSIGPKQSVPASVPATESPASKDASPAVISPKASVPVIVTSSALKPSTAASTGPTPVSAADSEASELASLISQYAATTPAVGEAPQGLSALAANADTLGLPKTPSSAASTMSAASTATSSATVVRPESPPAPKVNTAPSMLAIPSASGAPDTPSMYSASSASAYSPSVASPTEKPSPSQATAPNVARTVSKPSVSAPPPATYVEPVIGPAPKERRSFQATVHRKAPTEPPAPMPKVEVPQPRTRVPTQTVSTAETSTVGDELSSLLNSAWRLEERLDSSPAAAPPTDSFADLMSNAFSNIGTTLTEPPTRKDSMPTHERVQSNHSHKRSDSNATLKAAAEGKGKMLPPPPPPPIVHEPEQVIDVHHSRFISDESPITPPPKSGGRFSSLRSKGKAGSLKSRMSMLLPEGRESRQSVTSEDGGLGEFEHVSPPRMSRSSGHLRDDVSMISRQSGGSSSWSFRSAGSKKGLQRAATFAEKIWPGRSKSRTPSTMSAVSAENTIGECIARFLYYLRDKG